MTAEPTSFFVIVTAALLAPLLAAAIGRYVAVAAVVIELLLGIAIGPQGLELAHIDVLADFFGTFGLAFLFLLAGYEIDFERIRGTPLRLALIGWTISLVLSYAIAGGLEAAGIVVSGLLTGSAMATTAIGTLLPILRDNHLTESRMGQLLLAAGAVGEFGPIVIITLLLSGRHDEAGIAALLLVFVAVAVLTAVLALRAPARLLEVVSTSMETSGQLPIRMTIALLIGLVALANRFGLDLILGAFAAGIIVRLVSKGRERELFESKLDAVGYGFAIPAFFITSGMRIDVQVLFGSAGAALKVPLFLALFLLIRGLPALLLYRTVLPQLGERVSLAFLSATQLPLVVAVTVIGVDTGRMRTSTAAALVGAAVLSTLIYPLLGMRAHARVQPGNTPPGRARAA